MRRGLWLLVVVVVIAAFVRWKFGVYTVQPIGALPKGRTLIVWRDPGEPFFNSPDARCLERLGSVSLFCRAAAFSAAPTDRVIARLPYSRWAYLASTDGKEFDR